MTDDPKRLLDDAGPSNELRDLLHAGRAEMPTERQLAALALKLGAIAGGGAAGGGAAAAAGAAKAGAAAGGAKAGVAGVGAVATKGIASGLAVKITAAAVVASVAAGGTAYVVHEKHAAPPATTAVGLVATRPASSSTATTPAVAPIPAPPPDPVATVVRAPSAARADPADDFGLVDRAQKAGSAERALDLCNEHARKFANGSFAQEREVIAIKSLVELGRRPEAEARARRFSTKFPGSAQQRRVDAILSR